VAPWQSVYKIHLMVNTEITFVLAKGGHNAGIVSEPGHKGRSYRQHTRKPAQPYLDPTEWFEKAERHKDSWWFSWHAWLTQHSAPQKVSPPICPTPLRPAPGLYVLQR
jgi:polyhydroxyalkanoate synthase